MSNKKIICIDIQPYYTTIVIFENGKAALIGDGYFKHIPNLADGNHWGTEFALKSSKDEYFEFFINPYQLSDNNKVVYFINGLYKRVFEYIGFEEPDYAINKYDVIFTFQSQEITKNLEYFINHLRVKFKTAKFYLSKSATHLLATELLRVEKDKIYKSILLITIGETKTDIEFAKINNSQIKESKYMSIEIGWMNWYLKFYQYMKQSVEGLVSLNPVLFLESTMDFFYYLKKQQNHNTEVLWKTTITHLLKSNNKEYKFSQEKFQEIVQIPAYLENLSSKIQTVLNENNLKKTDAIMIIGRGGKWLFKDSFFAPFANDVIKSYETHDFEVPFGFVLNNNYEKSILLNSNNSDSDNKTSEKESNPEVSKWDWTKNY